MRLTHSLIGFTLACLIGAAQAAEPQADRERAHAAAVEIMNAARHATLVTLDKRGRTQARIVDPLVATDRTLWIATNPLSRKAEEIRRHSRVTLLFFNAAANEYVTVHGDARIVTDAETKAARWKQEWAPFYKPRHGGADFMLIEVRAKRLEISSARLGFSNDATTWKPVIVDLDRKK